MADRIKGITVVLGGDTTGLNKALAGTNKEIKSTQSQLKDVERLLKLDPKNTQLLEQRQRLLADVVGETKTKLEALKRAEKQLTVDDEKYQQWEKAMASIQGQTTKTENAIQDLKKELKNQESGSEEYERLSQKLEKSQNRLKELQEQAEKTFEELGKPISQKQYDALQREIVDTEQELSRLENQADQASKAMSGIGQAAQSIQAGANAVSATAGKVQQSFAPVTAGIVGLGTAAVATIPATEELRSDLSKLDANARENGAGADEARAAWRQFAIQSGETDSAVEATSNLLQAGFTESNLQKAVEGLAGAAQRFPDTLKVESLADSLQETLATGTATGQFGELLDRLGIGAENFTEQLAGCKTEAEKQNLALETLANAGLNDSYKAWKQNNEEMLANQEANLKLQESMAEVAEVALPVVTTVTEKVAELLDWLTGLDSKTQTTIAVVLGLIAAISPAAGIISAIASAISFLTANPMVLLIAAIVALVTLIAVKGEEIKTKLMEFDAWLQGVFLTDWTEIFGPVLGELLNMFFANVQNVWNSILLIFTGVIDFIRGIFTGNWQQAWQGVQDIFAGIFNGLVDIAKAPLNGIIGLLNMAINAINQLIDGFNSLGFDLPEWLGGGSWHPSLPYIPSIPYLAKGGTVLSGSAIVGEAGPELLTVGPGGTRVLPLTGSGAGKGGAAVSIGSISFYGYTHQQGSVLVRDLNRQLGRLYK